MQKIFLYCIYWPSTLLLQLTRAGTQAFKFHWFYKPFETFGTYVTARALFLQNGQYFIGFISNYEKSESNCSLTGPELKCCSRLRNFICFDATSNYNGESDGYVALLSPWKFAMFWNNRSNSLQESNVFDSVDLSARHSINYLINY